MFVLTIFITKYAQSKKASIAGLLASIKMYFSVLTSKGKVIHSAPFSLLFTARSYTVLEGNDFEENHDKFTTRASLSFHLLFSALLHE